MQVIDYYGLAPQPGRTHISIAKKKLCVSMGLHPKKFGDILKAAATPAALVAHFGYGALLPSRITSWGMYSR
jgi:hypothetical protein